MKCAHSRWKQGELFESAYTYFRFTGRFAAW